MIGVELISPKMSPGSSVNELGIDAHACSTLLRASLQRVTHSKLFADLFNVDSLASIREGGRA